MQGDESVERLLAVEVLHLLGLPGAYSKHRLCQTVQEGDEAVERVLAVEVLHLLRSPGAYSSSVNDSLGASEVWQAYKHQKHDLFLPSGGDRSVRHHLEASDVQHNISKFEFERLCC